MKKMCLNEDSVDLLSHVKGESQERNRAYGDEEDPSQKKILVYSDTLSGRLSTLSAFTPSHRPSRE
jgi:hypothetical protein